MNQPWRGAFGIVLLVATAGVAVAGISTVLAMAVYATLFIGGICMVESGWKIQPLDR